MFRPAITSPIRSASAARAILAWRRIPACNPTCLPYPGHNWRRLARRDRPEPLEPSALLVWRELPVRLAALAPWALPEALDRPEPQASRELLAQLGPSDRPAQLEASERQALPARPAEQGLPA
jgi:hypothetical protein